MTDYHCDFAIQHWAAKLGKHYQTIALLSFLWNCAGDPWAERPKVSLAASRLKWLAASPTVRSRATSELKKIGAIKKSKGTRSGVYYTLIKPPVSELSPLLRYELETMSQRDYRFDKRLREKGVKQPRRSEPRHKDATRRIPRKEINAYFRRNMINPRKAWPAMARAIEFIAGLSKGSVRYKSGSKDVEALSSWLLVHKFPVRAINAICRICREDHETKPTGNALRYVFEGDTEAKQAFLRSVMTRYRERAAKREK